MAEAATDALSTVEAYHRAWTSGAYLTGFVPMLTDAPEHTRMTDGNRVALWYFPQRQSA